MRAPAELLELQRWFFRRLTGGRRSYDDAHHLNGDLRLDPKERLGIYAGMYLARILEALEQDFPKTRELLGADLFGELATAYLRAHPSRHPSLRHAGDRLPRYLATSAWRVRAPYLADLARFERAQVDAFDAADAEPLRREALASVPAADWAGLRFGPHPSLALLGLRFAVVELWEALDQGRRTTTPKPRPHAVRVWRRGFEVFHAPMDPLEARTLRAAVSGRPFGGICHLYGDPAPAARALATWLEEGLLVEARRGPKRRRRSPQPLG